LRNENFFDAKPSEKKRQIPREAEQRIPAFVGKKQNWLFGVRNASKKKNRGA